MGTKLLVIDDDPNICDLLRYFFENEGYEVKTAGDGVEGISFFKMYEPDIVLLDLMLPKNKDGNVTQNCKALMFNSHDNIVAIKGDKLVVASGLEGYIVADVDDALLIVPMAEEQKIKQYVNDVKAKFGDKYL